MLGSHLRYYEAETSAEPLLPWWLDGVGGSGVDLFFVISGFVMVYVTRGSFGSAATPAVFLYNRATRIYPPVWLFTALALAGFYAVGSAPDWLDPSSILPSFLLWPTALPPLLGVSWTLIHEMYFYLVFALFLSGPARWLRSWLAVWAIIVLAGNFTGLGRIDPRLAIALHPMTLEFILGCIAGLLACSGRRKFAPFALVLGLALYVLAWIVMAFTARDGGPLPLEWARTLACGPAAFLLVYGMAVLEADHGWRAPRPLVALGDWSYALYLSHPLVLAALALLWAPWEQAGNPLDNIAWMATAAAAAIGFAALAYLLFERPVLALAGQGRRRLFGKTPLPPRQEMAARIW